MNDYRQQSPQMASLLAHYEKRSSSNGFKIARRISDRFVITPSANTVTTSDGRTITWPYFLRTIAKLPKCSMPGENDKAGLTQLNSILVWRGIWLAMPPSDLPKPMTLDWSSIRSRNSEKVLDDLPSDMNSSRLLEELIARGDWQVFSKNAETYKERFGLTDASIQYLIGRSKDFAKRRASLYSKGIVKNIPATLTTSPFRRQNAILKSIKLCK